MKTMQNILVALAAILGTACVDTVGEGSVAGLIDASPVLPADTVGKDINKPDIDAGEQPQSRPCTLVRDCQPLADTCNTATCVEGHCALVPLETEAPCDARDVCTVNAHCQSGACVGTLVCTRMTPIPYYPLPPSPYQAH